VLSCNPAGTDAPAQAGSPSARPRKELQQITGSSVYFGITTYVLTDCGRYEQQFPDAAPFSIVDQSQLHKIRQHLDALQVDTTGVPTNVRAKAILRNSDHSQDTLCMGKFNCCYQGRTLVVDTVLYTLLKVDYKL
jgi:hypothetical protein